MIAGLHGPNQALPTDDNDPLVGLLKLARPSVVKLLDIDGCHHQPTDVGRLVVWGVPLTVLRVEDWYPDSRFVDPVVMAHRLATTINLFYRAGTRHFQIFNEPNWLWLHLPWGPWQYQYYLRLLVTELRSLVPSDCQLIGPPLSYSSALWHRGPSNPSDFTLDDWVSAFEFAGSGPAVTELFDYNGFNSYWQYTTQLMDPSYGRNYTKWPRPWVCEYGKSPVPGLTPASMELLRVTEYPQWLERAEGEGVLAAHLFIWGGTASWLNYQLTGPVARALS